MRRPRSRTGLCPSKVKLTSSTPWRCAAAPKAASVPVAPPLKRMQSSRLTSAPPRGRSLRLHACGQTDALPAAPPRRPRPAWRAPHLVGRARRVRSPDWRALPVVVGRPARLVHLPEGELDGQVELHFPGARVGHLEVKARAVDVDHGRDERRARAPREVVEGEGLDRADLVGEAHALEIVAREAAEADALARVLHAAAAPAAEPGEGHVVVAVAEVFGGRDARPGAAVVLGGEELAEAEVEVVARQLGAAREVPADAATPLEPLDDRRRLEHERLGTVAVADQQDALAGLRTLERRRQQERRERRPRVAYLPEERVLRLRRLEAELAHQRAVTARVGTVEHQLREVLRPEPRLRQQPAHHLAHAGAVAVVDDEAVLPRVHEGIALGAPHVDDLVRDRVARRERERDVLRACQEGRGAVAQARLERRARRRHTRLAGDHQDALRRAGLHRIERGAERGRARAQRVAHVGRHDVAAEVERARHERRGLFLLERIGGGCEEDAVDGRTVDPPQAVDRRRYRHRDRVLVPVGDRLLGAARLRGAAADRGQGEAQHGDVGAVRGDADHRANLESGRANCNCPRPRRLPSPALLHPAQTTSLARSMLTTDAVPPPADDTWLGCNPFDPAFRHDPYPSLARLRALDPVNEMPVGIWRLTRYADVNRLLHDVPAGVRTTDGVLPGVDESLTGQRLFMLQQDPPTHTRLRRLVSSAFTPRAIAALRPQIQRIVDACLARVAARGAMDVIADLGLPVPATVICEMLGVPVEDRDRFTVWTSKATLGLASQFLPPETLAEVQAAGNSLASYFEELIAGRRGRLSDDLLSALIRAEEAGDRLAPPALLSQAIGLLIAGFETTIGLIGNGVRALVRHPAELAKLRARPELAASAVDECLRYDGPIILTPRVLHADVEFGGKTLPKDTKVFGMLAAADRDPAVFPEPDRFDIERRPNDHLAFGGGPHFCLGAHLAKLEGEIAIASLVTRFADLRLVSETVEWGASLFRVPGKLPITFRAH